LKLGDSIIFISENNEKLGSGTVVADSGSKLHARFKLHFPIEDDQIEYFDQAENYAVIWPRHFTRRQATKKKNL